MKRSRQPVFEKIDRGMTVARRRQKQRKRGICQK